MSRVLTKTFVAPLSSHLAQLRMSTSRGVYNRIVLQATRRTLLGSNFKVFPFFEREQPAKVSMGRAVPVRRLATEKHVIEVNDNNFEEKVLKASGLVLVDFYADWCGPCRMLAPIMEKIAQENKNVSIVKLNSDENERTVSSYGIMSLPTVVAFRDGKPVSKFIGLRDANWIKDFIQQI